MNDGIGWGTTIRVGELNEDGAGSSSVSNGFAKDYFSVEVFNSRVYDRFDMKVFTSIGWAECANRLNSTSDEGITYYLSLNKTL